MGDGAQAPIVTGRFAGLGHWNRSLGARMPPLAGVRADVTAVHIVWHHSRFALPEPSRAQVKPGRRPMLSYPRRQRSALDGSGVLETLT